VTFGSISTGGFVLADNTNIVQATSTSLYRSPVISQM